MKRGEGRTDSRWREVCEEVEMEEVVESVGGILLKARRTGARKPDLDEYDGEPRLEWRGLSVRHHQ